MTIIEQTGKKLSFREELHKQRWDDHRYYHHNRINQTLQQGHIKNLYFTEFVIQ